MHNLRKQIISDFMSWCEKEKIDDNYESFLMYLAYFHPQISKIYSGIFGIEVE